MTQMHRGLAVTILLAVISVAAPASITADQPNVLIVITDEHNFRTLGCYRELLPTEQAEMWGPGTVVPTPNLDRLAAEGVICTRAYATAPVCSPCRAAMITGLYPHNTGVPTNNENLRQDIPTLATILAASGYRTGFIGKWHLGGASKPGWAPEIDGGFQHKEFMFNRGHWKKLAFSDEGPSVGARDAKGQPSYDVDGADQETFTTDFLTNRAIEYVSDASRQPFLCVVSYPDPHGPNTVRQPYDHMFDQLRFLPPRTYGRDDMPIPGWLGGAKNHAKFVGDQMSRYFGMVKCIDDNFGRLMKSLETSGRLDSTIVLMTSDHGDLCYEHDRLNKGNPYEGSARVPLLIRYPKRLTAKTVYRQPVGTVDITPTLLGVAQLSDDSTFEGRDLSDVLSGGDQESDSASMTFLRNAGKSPQWLAAIDPRYKLVVSVNDRPWLFDAESDPDELLNFFGRPGTQQISDRLGRSLRDHAAKVNDPFAENEQIRRSIDLCIQP